MLYVASQCIQGLLGAFFQYENAVLNGEQEKNSIIHVRLGLKNLSLSNTVCHHSAGLMMPISDPQDVFFFLTYQRIRDRVIPM